jgi:hypothetical protein
MGMGKQLSIWFVYRSSFRRSSPASRPRPPGGHSTARSSHRRRSLILAYASAIVPNAIWWGRSWSSTLKEVIDGSSTAC